MPEQISRSVYASAGWEIDFARRELRSHGVSVPIGTRAFEVLEVLVQAGGELVNKYELMSRVWPGAVVEENTLHFHISAVRKALGPDRGMLKTASGRGYRLLGDWQIRDEESTQHDPVEVQRARGPVRPFQTNVPLAASALIGRGAVAQHLRDLLTAYRVVTLTGPGGIGKTVLGLEVARSLFRVFPGDICVAELASLTDWRLVPSAVAGALGLGLGGGETSSEAVARAIGAKRLLLALDNCEHVIDAAAEFVELVVRMCPGASILATSRELLRIDGECVYRVPLLDVPPERLEEPAEVLGHSAVQLFIARIKSFLFDFSPEGADLKIIGAICRRLDGIPLAIEFAAARAATLGLDSVLSRLDDRFALLTRGRRTALPRHRTLRATLDWSYELLPHSEQRLLCRLAVFPAGFTLEAATAVMSDVDQEELAVAEGIANLVAKSLVTLDGSTPTGRWRLFESIRAYALNKLAESDETEQVARQSAEFLRDLFRPTGRTSQGHANPDDNAVNRREIDNVRAAIDWALSPTGDLSVGLELTANSAPLWFQLSLMAEYRERAERALKRLLALPEPDDALEMRLLIGLGHALWYSGPGYSGPAELQAMERAFRRALALAERAGNTDLLLQALRGNWAVGRGRGDHRATLAAATRYQTVASATGEKRFTVLADRMLALTHHDLGDQNLARRHVENVLGQARHLDPRSNVDLQVDARVAMLALLIRIQWIQGFADQATTTAQEAIDTALRTDHWFSVCYVLFMAGCPLSLWVGNLAEAKRRIGMLGDLAGGNPGFIRYTQVFGAILRLRQGTKGDALTAAYLEPRVQYSTMAVLDELTSAATISVPSPDDVPFDTPWSLPEVLRVDAELLLWRGGPDAVSAAEAKLRRSLELAREQSALSWELRTALSLARLRIGQGRLSDAQQLLSRVYDKFTEGFETLDLRSAETMLESLPQTPTVAAGSD